MAVDHELHEFDHAGFMIDKKTRHRVGFESAPIKSEPTDYPKWVSPHASHVAGEVAPEFSASHRPRGGSVMVLVHDADEEARAVSAKEVAPVASAPVEPSHEDHEGGSHEGDNA